MTEVREIIGTSLATKIAPAFQGGPNVTAGEVADAILAALAERGYAVVREGQDAETQIAAREQGMYALCQRLCRDWPSVVVKAYVDQHAAGEITTETLFDEIMEARDRYRAMIRAAQEGGG